MEWVAAYLLPNSEMKFNFFIEKMSYIWQVCLNAQNENGCRVCFFTWLVYVCHLIYFHQARRCHHASYAWYHMVNLNLFTIDLGYLCLALAFCWKEWMREVARRMKKTAVREKKFSFLLEQSVDHLLSTSAFSVVLHANRTVCSLVFSSLQWDNCVLLVRKKETRQLSSRAWWKERNTAERSIIRLGIPGYFTPCPLRRKASFTYFHWYSLQWITIFLEHTWLSQLESQFICQWIDKEIFFLVHLCVGYSKETLQKNVLEPLFFHTGHFLYFP